MINLNYKLPIREPNVLKPIPANLVSILYADKLLCPGVPFYNAGYNIDGTIGPVEIDNYAKINQLIFKYNKDGSRINTYLTSIIRPRESTHWPSDIKQCTLLTSLDGVERCTDEKQLYPCRDPCYTGTKFEQWCSEKNEMGYYGMRPLITSEQYNALLKQLFNNVVASYDSLPRRDNIALGTLMAVFSLEPKENVMSMIMTSIALQVSKMPEMQRNASWVSEQFYYTDAELYETKEASSNSTYFVRFMLYNALRSTANQVQCIIRDNKIIFMDFTNGANWNTNTVVDGISGHNVSRVPGRDKSIWVPFNSLSTEQIDWNYGNTLLKLEFNLYGFYQKGNNVDVSIDVPDSLKGTIAAIEKYERNSYLLPAGEVNYNGIIKDVAGNAYATRVGSLTGGQQGQQGLPKNVYSNPQVAYHMPLELVRDKGRLVATNNVTGSIAGLINT